MEARRCKVKKDLVVAGGGFPGICTAVQAARMGLKVALINNRGYIGGNSGAELMIGVAGATGTQEFNYNARETGVTEEILLENLYKNPMGSRYIWDGVLMDVIIKEENIELFENTNVDEVVMKDEKNISHLIATQNTTETIYEFYSPLFVDDTGDGTVAYLAGAQYRYGREAKTEFGERVAPDEADNCVLPSTMAFYAKDVGKKITYRAPSFAVKLEETDVLKYRTIPPQAFDRFHWFFEIDGQLDQIFDAEKTIQNHRNLVYGIWDYIKNSGNFPSENYDLEYVSPIPGKRESRRIVGDYMLKESDIVEQKDFEDAVGHGGWSIDLHAIDGFYSQEPINRHIFLKGIYQIPYRCGYSKSVDNLFIEGRCMSTTHVAFGTTRVIATLATLAQANAVAAYLCKKYNTIPRGIYENHLEELQKTLLKYDQHIVGKKYQDEENLAFKAKLSVSSEKVLEITEKEFSKTLEEPISLSVPVISKFKGVSLLLKGKKDTTLHYVVYKPSKKENYCPSHKLFEGSVKVSASSNFDWVALDADIKEESTHLFIEIVNNEDIEIALAQTAYTGVVSCVKHYVDHDSLIDLDTLGKKKEIWHKNKEVPCFKMMKEERVFAGENLINGYARPYGLPNIWHSKGVDNEYIKLSFDKEKEISEVVLFFDSFLDFNYSNNKTYDFEAMPTLVKDYDVLYKDAKGNFVTAKQIKNNYQRVNSIDMSKIKTDEIKIVFHKTNGQRFISVYEVRVY